jgi:hypothetical protein
LHGVFLCCGCRAHFGDARNIAKRRHRPASGTPQQFGATIRMEIDMWRKVVSDANIKAD